MSRGKAAPCHMLRLMRLACLAAATAACSSDSSPTSPTTSPPSTVGTFTTDPSAAELSVSDISNFWIAYDEYRAGIPCRQRI